MAEHPADPDLQLARARLSHEEGDWNAALAGYHHARSLGAAPAQVAVLEGDALLAAGWTRSALERYDAALAAEPDRATAHVGQARTLRRLDKPEEAADAYERAYTLLERANPSLVLEWTRALVAAGRPNAAVEILDAQLASMGRIPTLQLAAVELEQQLARHDAALRRIDALLDQVPGHPLWTVRRAEILEGAGRIEEARVAYGDALEATQARLRRRPNRRMEALAGEVRLALQRVSIPLEGPR